MVALIVVIIKIIALHVNKVYTYIIIRALIIVHKVFTQR